jgi:hypothetical protein
MSDPWKPVVSAAGGKPGGAALAQGLFVTVGLVAVLWYLSACMALVGFEDYKEPGRAARRGCGEYLAVVTGEEDREDSEVD